MPKYRVPKYIPKEDYNTALHYAKRYPVWKEELNTAPDTSRAIRYDTDKVQTSNNFDPVQTEAIRREAISRKVSMIDEIIDKTGKELAYFLRLGVCYGLNFNELEGKGIPCSRNTYYTIRRAFYIELASRI